MPSTKKQRTTTTNDDQIQPAQPIQPTQKGKKGSSTAKDKPTAPRGRGRARADARADAPTDRDQHMQELESWINGDLSDRPEDPSNPTPAPPAAEAPPAAADAAATPPKSPEPPKSPRAADAGDAGTVLAPAAAAGDITGPDAEPAGTVLTADAAAVDLTGPAAAAGPEAVDLTGADRPDAGAGDGAPVDAGDEANPSPTDELSTDEGDELKLTAAEIKASARYQEQLDWFKQCAEKPGADKENYANMIQEFQNKIDTLVATARERALANKALAKAKADAVAFRAVVDANLGPATTEEDLLKRVKGLLAPPAPEGATPTTAGERFAAGVQAQMDARRAQEEAQARALLAQKEVEKNRKKKEADEKREAKKQGVLPNSPGMARPLTPAQLQKQHEQKLATERSDLSKEGLLKARVLRAVLSSKEVRHAVFDKERNGKDIKDMPSLTKKFMWELVDANVKKLIDLNETLLTKRKTKLMELIGLPGAADDDAAKRLSPDTIDTDATKELQVPTYDSCLTTALVDYVLPTFDGLKLLREAFGKAKADALKRKEEAKERAAKKRKAGEALAPAAGSADSAAGSAAGDPADQGFGSSSPAGTPASVCSVDSASAAPTRVGAEDPMAAMMDATSDQADQADQPDQGPDATQPPVPSLAREPSTYHNKAPAAAADAMDIVRDDIDGP